MSYLRYLGLCIVVSKMSYLRYLGLCIVVSNMSYLRYLGLCIVVSNIFLVFCVVFFALFVVVLIFMHPMLQLSLDYHFLITSSVYYMRSDIKINACTL
jgi:hypothetical protein